MNRQSFSSRYPPSPVVSPEEREETEEPTSMLDDDREIVKAYYERGGGFEVGEDGITRIEAYKENGQMAHVPWIAVYREGELYKRIPARWLVITYDVPEPETESSDAEPDDDLPF